VGPGEPGRLLAELAAAGSGWAVVAQPGSVDSVVQAIEESGLRSRAVGGSATLPREGRE
jgi:hypothetical protein